MEEHILWGGEKNLPKIVVPFPEISLSRPPFAFYGLVSQDHWGKHSFSAVHIFYMELIRPFLPPFC